MKEMEENIDKITQLIKQKTEKEYNYSSSFIDPQGDQIYYWFDWGDGNNSGWIGPRNSNETGEATHKWNETGIYKIAGK